MAAQKSWKNTGMLAGIADCGMSWKWGCRGGLALGFKIQVGSHPGGDHMALGRESQVPPLGDHAALEKGRKGATWF